MRALIKSLKRPVQLKPRQKSGPAQQRCAIKTAETHLSIPAGRPSGALTASPNRKPLLESKAAPGRDQQQPRRPDQLKRAPIIPTLNAAKLKPAVPLQLKRTPNGRTIDRPNIIPREWPSKSSAPRARFGVAAIQPPPVAAVRPGGRQPAVQRFASRVVQALKFYPNLHPGAVESVDPGNVFKLDSFANQYRLRRVNSHGVNVPNQQYNFVRTREGEMLLHARYRHPSIAEGKQVLYAGEIFFNNGQLEWWSNGSGHYQPVVEDAEQAALPMNQFFSYQQIIKGEHKRKRG